MSELFVKICGITQPNDALLAVGFGASAIGLVFAPSKRQVSLEEAAGIVGELPDGVLSVGVFRNNAPLEVIDIASELGLGAVQLHGNESVADAHFISTQVPLVIKAFVAGDSEIASFRSYGASYFLVDGPSPGSGHVFDWQVADGVDEPAHMIFSGGLTPENVGAAVARMHPYGVDVSSGVESEPGRKDPRKVRAFIAAAREAATMLEDTRTQDQTSDKPPYDWSDR